MNVDRDLVHLVKAGDPEGARKYGLTLIAECGLVWVPRKRRLKDYPPCPECEAIGGPIAAAKRPESEMSATERRTHFVYRCYDAAGTLLYVGCSVDLATRRLAHSAQSWWYPQVASYRLIVFPNRRHALRIEAQTIHAERPLWNVRHQDFAAWPKEQIERGRELAVIADAPDAVQRRFARLAEAA